MVKVGPKNGPYLRRLGHGKEIPDGGLPARLGGAGGVVLLLGCVGDVSVGVLSEVMRCRPLGLAGAGAQAEDRNGVRTARAIHHALLVVDGVPGRVQPFEQLVNRGSRRPIALVGSL